MIADDRIPLRVVVPFTVWNGSTGGAAEFEFTTSVTEPVAAYSAGTSYVAGNRVSLTSASLSIARRGIYEALAATTGEFPPDFPA